MPKIPDCDRCQYFLRSPFLVCAVNPCGPDGDSCSEFEASTKGKATTARQPIGGGYYLGDWVPQPFPLRSADEQLALLDWHPQFTGRCPNCEMPIAARDSGGWHCEHCDWKDET